MNTYPAGCKSGSCEVHCGDPACRTMNWDTAPQELEDLRAQAVKLEEDRHNMQFSYAFAHGELLAVKEQLAAAQAREAKLRKALMLYQEALWPHDPDYETCAEALALPADDTALRERLVVERELCAKVCEQDLCNRPSDPPANYFDGGLRHCATAIRSMK